MMRIPAKASADSVSSIFNVMLYPNPAKDYAVLYMNQEVTPLQLQVIDALGNKLIDQSIAPFGGYYTFSTALFSDGMYYVNLLSGKSKIFSGKLSIFK